MTPPTAVPQPAPTDGKMGRQVLSMAKEILDARSNPFLNKLPIPDIVSQGPQGTEDVNPSTQAFQSVVLSGIVKRGSHWMALLKMANGSSEMVKSGDVLNIEGQMMKVGEIRSTSVDVFPLGADKEKDKMAEKTRTLFLPDIIGFGAGSAVPDAGRTMPRGNTGTETPSGQGKGLSDIFKGLTENLSDKSSEILNGLQEPN